MVNPCPENGACKVFISHRTEDKPIAMALVEQLRRLSENKLDPVICYYAIQGGKNWREEIQKGISESSIFIFLYTDEGSNWQYCLYEAGLFRGNTEKDERYLVTLRNAKIELPPPPLDDLQSYRSTIEELRRFYYHLLLEGRFTDGRQLVTIRDEEHRDRVKADINKAVDDFVTLFAYRRIRYFAKRLALDLSGVDFTRSEQMTNTLLEDAKIVGNEQTMELLGVSKETRWGELYRIYSRRNQAEWLQDIVDTLSQIRACEIPNQTLSPFTAADRTQYVPVITRIDYQDIAPIALYVIFIQLHADVIYLSDPPFTVKNMPNQYRDLFLLFEVALHFRWDVLELLVSDLRFEKIPMKDIWERLDAECADMEEHSRESGIASAGVARNLYPTDRLDELDRSFVLYAGARRRMLAIREDPKKDDLEAIVQDMQQANKVFLIETGEAFQSIFQRLYPIERKSES